ncbi:MAG: protein-export membrane protein SecF [Alphaproteobacteria bacterium RIFOXYD12_FULL_60_8]|nr:MAG: protein-export membrane protein SecF [Alphaproteobacteria bacterium RIFOXYD12_FULL_60_8]
MFRIVDIFPPDSKFDFIGRRKLAMTFSALLILGTILSVAVKGLNYGIDFAGGILLEVKTPVTADLAHMRQSLTDLQLGEVALQGIGGADDQVMIRLQRQEGGEEAQQVALDKVREVLGPGVEYRRVETVGPKVGGELVWDSFLSVGLAILAICAYVTFRFEWHYGLGAMIALIHDVITTVGLFSILGLEFSLTTVAALLTIAGYSINDTVVICDRVRENMRKYKKMELAALLNLSLNETLSRTIMTSTTTLLSVVAIFVFGGDVLWGFAFAMIWGIVIGTYSSVYIALPILLILNYRDDSGAETPKSDENEVEEEPVKPAHPPAQISASPKPPTH